MCFSALAMHAKPCLEKLTQDVDHDVQHFANEALESKLRKLVFRYFQLAYFDVYYYKKTKKNKYFYFYRSH